MRINEIAAPSTLRIAKERLLAAGYRQLGKGAYGVVFQKPGSPYVLKLFANGDAAYLAFLNLAMTHPNPHFPRVRGKIVRVTDLYSAVRLEPLTTHEGKQSLGAARLRVLVNYMRGLQHKLDPQGHDYAAFLDAQEELEDQPELEQACALIVKHLLGRFRLDLNINNIMLRGATLVIIDPVATDTNDVPIDMGPEPAQSEEPAPAAPPRTAAQRAHDDALLAELLADDLLK